MGAIGRPLFPINGRSHRCFIRFCNPWKANTLEWACASPPPHGNFPTLPDVHRGPYEYSVPGMQKDYLPQNEKAPEGARLEVH